jgi:coenzyme F420-reducing hydrogenase gamma subunit
MNGMTSRRNTTANSRKLTSYEESALVQYILDLDLRGFPPRPQAIQEMADLLLSERGESSRTRLLPLLSVIRKSKQSLVESTIINEQNVKI